MKLPDKVYDILKWIALIVLPALATAYGSMAGVWGWPYADEIAKTVAAICTLLGALLGISTAQYNKAQIAAGDGTEGYTGKHEAQPTGQEPVTLVADPLEDDGK